MEFQNKPIKDLASKKLYIFDMDGTIYLGNRVFDYAVSFIKKLRANGSSEMCIFGDRLYTDIALGAHNGMCAVLVMSGETVEEDLKELKPEDAPEYIFPSLAEVDREILG